MRLVARHQAGGKSVSVFQSTSDEWLVIGRISLVCIVAKSITNVL